MVLRSETRRIRRAAFTLMEMLVVVAIIVALAGIGGFFLMGALGEAKTDLARTQAKSTLTSACQAYNLKRGAYPDSLQQLLQQDARGGPYLDDPSAILDPWGQPFQYDKSGPRNNGRKPDIWTKDPNNGVDIGNWPLTQQ
jgi:general secretion pathway protein G